MEVFTNIKNINIDRSVVCVGTFDGLHQGHKVVINRTIEQAKRIEAKSIVFTFWPHPQEIINPDKPVYYLNTFQEKIDLFSETGVDYLVLFPFSKEFSNLSSMDFIKDYLIDQLKMRFFVIGYDHQFGKEREGKYEKMVDCAKSLNFGIERIEQQAISDEFVSSTKIRASLKEGRIEMANQLLGYTYFTSGEVMKGRQIGSSIGFPTANVRIAPNKIMPENGVYCIEAIIADKSYHGVANIGFKPTVEKEKELSLEVHLFDFDEDIYGKKIKIHFFKSIRSEIKFDNLELLKQQIQLDKQTALDFFKSLGKKI